MEEFFMNYFLSGMDSAAEEKFSEDDELDEMIMRAFAKRHLQKLEKELSK